MSLEQLTRQHTVDVQHLSITGEASLGWSETWTTIATLSCFIQPVADALHEADDRRGYQVTHRIYFTSDPGLGPSHRLLSQGRTFTQLRVRNVARQNRLWVVTAVETRT